MVTKTKKKMITIQQYASAIRRPSLHREHLKSLGLRGINTTREIEDTPSIQGLLLKVNHMVRIVSK